MNLDYIKYLYNKYASDLKAVKDKQRLLYNSKPFWPQFDDIEAEITYLRIREHEPETVVEISPCRGWSSTWILNALRDNNLGMLYSFDVIDFAKYNIPKDLAERWILRVGDAKEADTPDPDYLFIDSDHTKEFAEWYIEELFGKYKSIPVSVHDVFHTADPNGFSLEGGLVMDWLEENSIEWFTASANKNREGFDEIERLKESLGLSQSIHSCINNPCVFFNLK